MSKISVTNKKGVIKVINRISYPETLNERIFGAIVSGAYDGFLPLTIRPKRKETRIECVVQGMIPLTQYFAGIVTKKMFLDFALEMVRIIKSCEDNRINANNLDLQADRIFLDPYTKRVKCIYWPVVNHQNAVPPYWFLARLPLGLNFYIREDRAYLETYKRFFGNGHPFSLKNFERTLLSLSGKSCSSGHSGLSESLSGTLSGKKETEAKTREGVEYDPFADNTGHTEDKTPEKKNGQICPSCGTKTPDSSIFCFRCGTKLADKTPIKKSVVTPDPGENEGTTVLGLDEAEEIVCPVLVRVRTQKTVFVDKPVFRIGSGQRSCDLIIGDNGFISRNHADIITRDHRYYIVDRNSTNKTYIDGKQIPGEKEIEIFPGTKLRFANEEFEFKTES